MTLEREVATYRRHHAELLANEGQFVLVHGDEVLGVFNTLSDALREGYERFRDEPFLARQITAQEKVVTFSRSIRPWPPSRAS